MRLLVKWPSRSRAKLFERTATKYVELATRKEALHFLFTLDSDDNDLSAYKAAIAKVFDGLSYTIDIGSSRNKVHAINRGMEEAGEWDVVYLASDDMVPVREGWDAHIIDTFKPIDSDHLLWLNSAEQRRIPTLMAMDRAYYERFGYLYHSDYVSLFCDNEAGEVAEALGRLIKDEEVYIRNMSPDWGGPIPVDTLYRRNNRYYGIDRRTYLARKAAGFPINSIQ